MRPAIRQALNGLIIALIVIVCTLIMLAALERLGAEQQRISICVPDEQMREKVRAIMLEAVDQSLKEHIIRLHEVWMRDASERGQPERAITGAQHGIKAYIGGRTNALKWNPPLC